MYVITSNMLCPVMDAHVPFKCRWNKKKKPWIMNEGNSFLFSSNYVTRSEMNQHSCYLANVRRHAMGDRRHWHTSTSRAAAVAPPPSCLPVKQLDSSDLCIFSSTSIASPLSNASSLPSPKTSEPRGVDALICHSRSLCAHDNKGAGAGVQVSADGRTDESGGVAVL